MCFFLVLGGSVRTAPLLWVSLRECLEAVYLWGCEWQPVDIARLGLLWLGDRDQDTQCSHVQASRCKHQERARVWNEDSKTRCSSFHAQALFYTVLHMHVQVYRWRNNSPDKSAWVDTSIFKIAVDRPLIFGDSVGCCSCSRLIWVKDFQKHKPIWMTLIDESYFSSSLCFLLSGLQPVCPDWTQQTAEQASQPEPADHQTDEDAGRSREPAQVRAKSHDTHSKTCHANCMRGTDYLWAQAARLLSVLLISCGRYGRWPAVNPGWSAVPLSWGVLNSCWGLRQRRGSDEIIFWKTEHSWHPEDGDKTHCCVMRL